MHHNNNRSKPGLPPPLTQNPTACGDAEWASLERDVLRRVELNSEFFGQLSRFLRREWIRGELPEPATPKEDAVSQLCPGTRSRVSRTDGGDGVWSGTRTY